MVFGLVPALQVSKPLEVSVLSLDIFITMKLQGNSCAVNPKQVCFALITIIKVDLKEIHKQTSILFLPMATRM